MVTLALVGAGKWGQNFLKAASSLKSCQVKYVCTRSQETLNSLSDKYIKTTSVEELISKKIDGIIIATPASSHFKIAKKLLNRNFNLLIEKPLTTNYLQALELQKIWQNKKPKVLVDHIYLYNPAFLEFRELLRNFGPIKSIKFQGILSSEREVSIIWDWGPHPVSLMLDIVGKPVASVKASGLHKSSNNLVHTLKAELVFLNNIRGIIHVSWFGLKKIRKLTVHGGDKKIIMDETKSQNQKLSFYQKNILVNHPKYGAVNPLICELEEFISSISSNKKITSGISMGVKVVKILSAIEKSIKSGGKSVSLN